MFVKFSISLSATNPIRFLTLIPKPNITSTIPHDPKVDKCSYTNRIPYSWCRLNWFLERAWSKSRRAVNEYAFINLSGTRTSNFSCLRQRMPRWNKCCNVPDSMRWRWGWDYLSRNLISILIGQQPIIFYVLPWSRRKTTKVSKKERHSRGAVRCRFGAELILHTAIHCS